MTSWQVIEGDCVEQMRAMPECSVDAVVCDPPYGLEFMGKSWDRLLRAPSGSAHARQHSVSFVNPGNPTCRNCGGLRSLESEGSGGRTKCRCAEPDFPNHLLPRARAMQEWHEAWAREAIRVLKPGGHLLAFGGTRTYHRLACAVEDAGFEIRDSIANLSTPRSVQLDLLREWIAWTERAPHAGLRLLGPGADSVPAPVLLGTSLERSPASAFIAELRSSEAHRTDAASWRSALSPAGETSTESSALVSIAGNSPASHDPTSTNGSTARSDALVWLDASMEARIRAVEALKIWRGSELSSKRAATDALCAALTDALKAITCAQSETFRSYDTTLRTVCVSATTATTTASTAAHLIAFTADTLELQGGDASEASSSGPLLWIYGSGFPPSKSLDVSKAIDNAAGATREVVGVSPHFCAGRTVDNFGVAGEGTTEQRDRSITAPATPDAERWQGWGTALKPAHEPIVVARKPLSGTVAGNVLEHGTGALNVDGCRIGTETITERKGGFSDSAIYGTSDGGVFGGREGRWPANVVLDPDAAQRLDAEAGELPKAGGRPPRRNVGDDGRIAYGNGWHGSEVAGVAGPLDEGGGPSRFFATFEHREDPWTGGGADVDTSAVGSAGGGSSRSTSASVQSACATPATATSEPCPTDARRAFYCAKSSSAERDAGLDGFEPRGTTADGYGSIQTPKLDRVAPRENWTPHEVRNVHPTVKPIELMRWLCRLVTPPDGLILDPFTGSGTTGAAAVLEGFRFVGIEREPEYAAIARARIAWWAEHPDGMALVERLEAERERKAIADSGQLGLFGEAA